VNPATTMTGRRAVTVRHQVHGILETVSAVRVGGWGASAEADLVMARDGLGRVVIPGTSLAGALRAWLGSVQAADGSALFGPAALGKVFGDLEHKGQGGEICRVRVDDAVANGEAAVEIRDGVGIDRATATAAAGVLYQHEVVPPGARFAFRITAEQTSGDTERVAEALDLLVAALTGGRVEIGAARTRGLGAVRLSGVQRTRVDLEDRDQVLAWLCGQPLPTAEPGPAGSTPAVADGRLGIDITWAAVTPVMVRASTVNEPEPDRDRAVDTVPLRTTILGRDGGARLLLPGSSIKGVLRSHAERIVRTLAGISELPDRWLDQLKDLEPVGVLFGLAGDHPDPDADGPAADAQTAGHEPADMGRRGALSVHDCHGTCVQDRVVTHVAVDRWTGGAAENLLFSVQEPAAAQWQPIRMSLDVRRASGSGGDEGARAPALLLLFLRDLADCWLALGFGGTRGRGSVSVSRVAFSGNTLPGSWAELAGRTLAEVIADPPDGVRRAFTTWQEAAQA